MRAAPVSGITAASLLAAWERGRAAPPWARALALLAAADPGRNAAERAALPFAARDRALLALRSELFGPVMETVVPCPGCGETLEAAVPLADLPGPEAPEEPLTVEADGWRLAFRLPATADVEAVEALPPAERPGALIERCLLQAEPIASATPNAPRTSGAAAGREATTSSAAGTDASPPRATGSDAGPPPAALAAMAEAMAARDPGTGLRIALRCPACATAWESPLDIAAFLWAEVDTWAHRTLAEIHGLASVYGWSEAEILSLSAWRRRAYLELAAQ